MGPISSYLVEDHRRLEDALDRSTTGGPIEPHAYWEFRGGLLRHIAMEEKVLFAAAQAARGGQALPLAARLRLDHGALAALLVLTPTNSIIAAIRHVLQRHNPLEEGPNGIYAECDQLLAASSEPILTRLQNMPPVAMAPYVDSAIAIDSARNALRRAGHDVNF
jgi:hypothetical protein